MGKIGALRGLLDGALREVTLPDSGLTLRIRRLNPYRLMGTAIPMGKLMSSFAALAGAGMSEEDVRQMAEAQVDELLPGHLDMLQAMIAESVIAAKGPGPADAWEKLTIVRPGNEPAVLGDDAVLADDFVRAFKRGDLRVLADAIWEHNGLGEDQAKILALFREGVIAATASLGKELRKAADGVAEAGRVRSTAECGDLPGGNEVGDGTGGAGEAGSAGTGGPAVEN